MLLLARGRRSAGEGRLGSPATRGSGGCCGLAGDRILRPELGKIGAESSRELTSLEPLGELLAGRDVAVLAGGGGDQSAEDAPLGHLQSLRHGRDPGEAGGEPGHIRLHV